MSAREVLSNLQFHPEVHGYDPKTVSMVPTHVVSRYVQQDRANPKEGYGQQSRETIDNLKKSISEKGWTTAISMAHDKENNWGAIIEGNHRVAAAKELGLSHIPVSVHTRGYEDDGYARTPRRGAPLTLDTKEELPNFGYVNPKHFKELR